MNNSPAPSQSEDTEYILSADKEWRGVSPVRIKQMFDSLIANNELLNKQITQLITSKRTNLLEECEEIKLRARNEPLGDAWNQYQTVLNLVKKYE